MFVSMLHEMTAISTALHEQRLIVFAPGIVALASGPTRRRTGAGTPLAYMTGCGDDETLIGASNHQQNGACIG